MNFFNRGIMVATSLSCIVFIILYALIGPFFTCLIWTISTVLVIGGFWINDKFEKRRN